MSSCLCYATEEIYHIIVEPVDITYNKKRTRIMLPTFVVLQTSALYRVSATDEVYFLHTIGF